MKSELKPKPVVDASILKTCCGSNGSIGTALSAQHAESNLSQWFQPEVCPDTIRESAYYKWQAAGCPLGDGTESWLEAEKELRGELC